MWTELAAVNVIVPSSSSSSKKYELAVPKRRIAHNIVTLLRCNGVTMQLGRLIAGSLCTK